MKNKHLIILGILIVALFVTPALVSAQPLDRAFNWVDITYEPNVPIPIEVNGYHFDQKNVIRGGDFLASYIVAIYTYMAGFVGIVAMFMLVIAGWRWLFAAGNASKINAAKDMVNDVLVGLALIFGGQLLLSQISEDFKYVQSLEIQLPEAALQAIADTEAVDLFCKTEGSGEEVDIDGDGEIDGKTVEECEDYKGSAEQCLGDLCFVGTPGDFDERCVPVFEDDEFKRCTDCDSIAWGSCDCDWYATAALRNADPCDCDGDEKWYDDICQD